MSIWQYKQIKKDLAGYNLLTLGEGNTPIDVVKANGNTLFIKREDKNPTGSWKDRGSAYKLTLLRHQSAKEAVISTSGNAAISYLSYSKLYPELKLHIVVTPNILKEKLAEIKELMIGTSHELHTSRVPKKTRAEIIAKSGAYNLAASTDSDILKGYWSLGFEIAKLILSERKKNDLPFYLFCPVSSGTALVGMVQGLLMLLENEYLMPHINVCQTPRVHPIVSELHPNEHFDEKTSKADAIIEKASLRSHQIIKIVRETNGDAYAISDSELEASKLYLKERGLEGLSYTSLLSVAGYERLRKKDPGLRFRSICIASGS